MKSKGSDDIQQLMIYEVTGDATPEESETLRKALENDAELRQKFEALKEKYGADAADNPLQRAATQWVPAHELMEKARQSPDSQFGIGRWLWAAAAIFVACIAGGYYFINSKHDVQVSDSFARNDNTQSHPLTGVVLTTAQGQTFSLTFDSSKNLSLKDVSLNNTNKTLTYTIRGGKVLSNAPVPMNRLSVPAGLTYQVVLSDGTEISLNSGTILEFPFRFNENAREVSLNGEAFFKVAKNPKLPFIVHAPNSAVQVLGTSFNVNSYDSGVVKVALVEGSVMFRSAGNQAMLQPGKQAVASKSKGGIKVSDFDKDIILSWRNGKYIFQNASLEEIAKVLTRWYGVPVELSKEAHISNDSFDGEVDRSKPIAKFLEDLQYATGLKYSIDPKGVLHFK